MDTYIITSLSGGYDVELEGTDIIFTDTLESAIAICEAAHPDWDVSSISVTVFPGKLTPKSIVHVDINHALKQKSITEIL